MGRMCSLLIMLSGGPENFGYPDIFITPRNQSGEGSSKTDPWRCTRNQIICAMTLPNKVDPRGLDIAHEVT